MAMGKTPLPPLVGNLFNKCPGAEKGFKSQPCKNKIRENCPGKTLHDTQTGKKSETSLSGRNLDEAMHGFSIYKQVSG